MPHDTPRLRDMISRAVRSPFKLPPLERGLARLINGSVYGGLLSKLPPPPEHYPFASEREVVRNGYRFQVDLSDLVGWYYYWGFVEASMGAYLDLCSPGGVVLDVGANIGGYALAAVGRVGPSGKVYAFEADPGNFSRLVHNVRLNRLDNIECLNLAISDAAGEVFIGVRDPWNRGMNQVTPVAVAGSAAVRATDLDAFVDERGLGPVALIKVDTEGYEYKVLTGAAGVIRRDRPTLFTEFVDENLRENGTSAGELASFVRDLGYKLFDVRTGRPLPPGGSLNGANMDVIARPACTGQPASADSSPSRTASTA